MQTKTHPIHQELIRKLEAGLSAYEESGCKTMSAEDASMAYAHLAALQRAERNQYGVTFRERKAEHMRIVNAANIGNAAMEAAFNRVAGRIGWAVV